MQEAIDNLKKRIRHISNRMSSESDTSSINSEEYKEIEREIERCAKVLEDLDRKRTMREQKNKLIEMRKEIERRLRKESNKGKDRMRDYE